MAKEWGLEETSFGFLFTTDPAFPGFLQVAFPLWLPTVLLAGMNWFVWRRTRSMGAARGAGRAFPVEPSANAAK